MDIFCEFGKRKLYEGGWLEVQKYECSVCGYVYDPAKGDPDGGIAPGTPFESLPDDWVCRLSGASKSEFEPLAT